MSIKTLSLAAAIALSLGLSTSVWAADDATPPPVAGATDAAKGADAADASKAAAEGDDAKKECIPKAETDAAAEGEAKDADKPAEAPADAAKDDDDVKLPNCDENGKAPKTEEADAAKEGDSAAAGDTPAEVPATEPAK